MAAGLRPDPLGELKRSPRPLATIRGPTSKGRGREGRAGKGRGGERRGRGGKGGGREVSVPLFRIAEVATLGVRLFAQCKTASHRSVSGEKRMYCVMR